ncbi:hypothetical protein ACRE_030900 [Hapsidospora chrysogenum ATCC 11550]|uniref:Uncharacterized protein n=1 Tax=Hapsidospora chrysogenum (strain ATCC 11550 / CBS 779.69 / DSM 880 / IAM 14645 / JCM 23072 / IMI 49137) TaxID=857340 RepID=A0A086T9P6_HAPC1|nr:hypothetical protein ACRE_030900 [Hapsidospora chrysogenum ATCC 11550]
MERPAYQTSDEFARVVWMAHILTYKNPYTWTAQDAPSDREDAAIDGTSDCDDESQCGDGFDEDMEDETASQDIGRLTAYDQDVREKFLDSIAELLSRSKGGKHVIATALRENEDSVEVDVARNDEFAAMDDEYLSSLTEFLALHGDGLSSQDTQSSAHKFLDTIFTYSRDRIIFWIERAARDLHDSRVSSRSPYLGLAKTSSDLCLLGCCSKLEIDAPAVTGALVWRLRFLSGVGSMTGASTTETLTAMGMRQVVELAAAALQNPEATQAALKTLVPSVDPVRITKSWRLLARPVTNLQVLFRIAKLLPNFRAATFVKIPLPPTIRLRRDQIPTISEASRILGLDDWDEILSKSVYNSVSACHPMTVPFTAVGDFVAIAGGPTAKGPSDRDMSLADFRHTLDFFSTYFDDTIRDPPLSGSIRAVKVSSQFEQSLYGHEEFSARAVDPGFSCTSDVSELSRALGQELRVCMLKKSDLERDAAGLNAATTNTQPNPYFAALMINIDASSDNWPRSTFRDWDGSLLLLREDGADLEVESAQRICRYCVEVLEPLFARSVAGEIPFSTVLKEVAPDRLMAWAQGGRQDPSIER